MSATKLKQFDLWGKPVEEAKPSTANQSLAFEGSRVRIRTINGETWWVAKDVCKILGIANHHHAVQGNPGRDDPGLDEDERGVFSVTTPSGEQQMLCVNESGLYALIFKSRKPEAKRFRKWVTSEVLPSIRKTGSYTIKDPISVAAKRLKCDRLTAEKRLENKAKNKEVSKRLAAENAAPRDHAAVHDAVHKGQFGRRARDLRKILGMKHGSPLDRMTAVPLAANSLAKAIAERIVQEQASRGTPIPLTDQPVLFETVARELVHPTLQPLGNDARYGLTDDPRRGLVIDVVQTQLTPPAA